MVRVFLATFAAVGVAAWWFGPTATGAPASPGTEVATMVPGTGAPDKSDPSPSADNFVAAPSEHGHRLVPQQGIAEGDAPVPARVLGLPLESSRTEPSRGEPPPVWVTGAPPSASQYEKSVRARGVNPCLTPDPGFGDTGGWDRSPSIGQMLVPRSLQLDGEGHFPVVFHFHGHEAARKEWVPVVDGAVLVGIDLGANSGPYLRKFADSNVFSELLASVEAGVAQRLGVERATIDRFGVSSWSAGYGAVERVLGSGYADRMDALVLLDGLHTGHADTERAQRMLEPFVEYARKAANEHTFMFVSHSSILPPTYASTTETANYLIWQLGGVPQEVSAPAEARMGLELFREFDHGHFHVRGYTGNGKLDHCAHLGLYREVLEEHLVPRLGLSRRVASR